MGDTSFSPDANTRFINSVNSSILPAQSSVPHLISMLRIAQQIQVMRHHNEGGAVSAAPVSYTHLDVYKRQAKGRLMRILHFFPKRLLFPRRIIIGAAEDVYKRQTLYPWDSKKIVR